jgi:hypothetical protein
MERTVGAVPLARNRVHEKPSNKPVKTSTASTAKTSMAAKNQQNSMFLARSITRSLVCDAVDAVGKLQVLSIASLGA